MTVTLFWYWLTEKAGLSSPWYFTSPNPGVGPPGRKWGPVKRTGRLCGDCGKQAGWFEDRDVVISQSVLPLLNPVCFPCF